MRGERAPRPLSPSRTQTTTSTTTTSKWREKEEEEGDLNSFGWRFLLGVSGGEKGGRERARGFILSPLPFFVGGGGGHKVEREKEEWREEEEDRGWSNRPWTV